MKFYFAILVYIKADFTREGAIQEILELVPKVNPSWEASEETVEFLEQCCNKQIAVSDETISDTKEIFLKAAFKDLSVLKNPEAMDLFYKIRVEVALEQNDNYIWSKSVKERPDGSAIIVLHVSCLEHFRKMIENHHRVTGSSLEEGVIAGN